MFDSICAIETIKFRTISIANGLYYHNTSEDSDTERKEAKRTRKPAIKIAMIPKSREMHFSLNLFRIFFKTQTRSAFFSIEGKRRQSIKPISKYYGFILMICNPNLWIYGALEYGIHRSQYFVRFLYVTVTSLCESVCQVAKSALTKYWDCCEFTVNRDK